MFEIYVKIGQEGSINNGIRTEQDSTMDLSCSYEEILETIFTRRDSIRKQQVQEITKGDMLTDYQKGIR